MKDEMAYIMRAIILAGIFCLGTLMDVGAQQALAADVYGYVYYAAACNDPVSSGTVRIYDADGDLLGSSSIDANGYYEVCDIALVDANPFPWKVEATTSCCIGAEYINSQEEMEIGNYCGPVTGRYKQVDVCVTPYLSPQP